MLEIRNISKVYGEGTTKIIALDNVSMQVDYGGFIAVMGPSGSGKSTLLNIIGGLDRPSAGEVVLNNQRIDSLDENDLVEIRRGEIAYVFQQYHLLLSLTALENVLLPLTFCGMNKEEETAKRLLQAFPYVIHSFLRLSILNILPDLLKDFTGIIITMRAGFDTFCECAYPRLA